MKHPKLKSFSFALVSFLSYLIFLLPPATADQNSDMQALLNFSATVPHARKLNWNPAIPICTSWIGVTCDLNQTHVIALRLPGVGLFGTIPANTLGKLDALRILSLRSNRLSGILPSDLTSLPSLHSLYLQHNNLSGDIPVSLPSNLNFLDLSFNSFTGEIPQEIQNLTQLTGLNLQNNSLYGPIPDFNLTRLKHLNLSYNQLNGSIPFSLQRFPNSSFLGNGLLCGPPLIQCSPTLPSHSPFAPLPPSPNIPQSQGKSSTKKLSTAAIIALAVGGSALLFLLALILLVYCLKKRDKESSGVLKGKGSGGGRSEKPKEESGAQEAEKNKLVFFEGCSYNFDLEDLLRASAEVLGKGSYGTAYKAVLEEGTTVVVKRMREVAVGKREFEQQMEMIGRVGQHLNVVPLRAYYYSKDEKLLVYDYVPAGSLSALLHGMHYLVLLFIASFFELFQLLAE